MPWVELSIALITIGGGGIVAATVCGQPIYDAVSKAIGAVTKRRSRSR